MSVATTATVRDINLQSYWKLALLLAVIGDTASGSCFW